jgi:hypothetical protein
MLKNVCRRWTEIIRRKMNSSKYELLNTFFKRYNPHKVAFKQAYLALSH